MSLLTRLSTPLFISLWSFLYSVLRVTFQKCVASWCAGVMTQIMHGAHKARCKEAFARLLSLLPLWGPPTLELPTAFPAALHPSPSPCSPTFPSELSSNVTCSRTITLICQTNGGSPSEVSSGIAHFSWNNAYFGCSYIVSCLKTVSLIRIGT